MIQHKFYQKLKDAACHLILLEQYTPLSNAAERDINELKKGAGGKLLQFRAPKLLGDVCLELEAYIIRLNTEIPKTVMLGKTLDISQFCKLNYTR